MEAIAKRRNLKGSPQKTRLVIDLIRGRNVSQALAILQFTNKRAADPVAKLLRSAIANATYQAEQQNIAIDPDELWVKTCFVDMGMHKQRRRLRPAPQGRAYQEQRHYCHITIEVSSEQPAQPVVKLKKSGNKIDPEKVFVKKDDGEKKVKAKKSGKAAYQVKEETPEVVAADAVKPEEPIAETVSAESPEVEASELKAEHAAEAAPVEDVVEAESEEAAAPEETDSAADVSAPEADAETDKKEE